VTLFRDLARDDAEQQMVALLNVRDDITRPYLAPPGVPAARLDILRRAFDATVRDEAFLADMKRQKLEIEEPSTGEELAALVADIARTPPAVVQRLVALFNGYK
jgi:tripartite-type tricarboxylate transporter receptor subunit TctC